MKRGALLATILCGAIVIVLGALGFLTQSLLQMEQDRARANYDDTVDEELRSAMWQLDSTGLDLILSGNAPLLAEDRQQAISNSRQEIQTESIKNSLQPEVTINNDARRRKAIEELKKQNGYAFTPKSPKKAVEKRSNRGYLEKTLRAETLSQSAVNFANKGEAPSSPKEAKDFPSTAWAADNLVLIESQNPKRVDFDALKALLLKDVLIAIPGTFELVRAPKNSAGDPLTMVTWPLQLQFEAVAPVFQLGFTPLRIALIVGWVAVLGAILALGALVIGSWRLSERRAAFVSSVTHELRTPLTTFQLYADMLSEGMVKEEQKQHYLQTMRSEAGRLARLVENVLAYAQIERGTAKAQLKTISFVDLIETILPHLEERCNQVEATLTVELPENLKRASITTDITGVEQIIFNLVDNACKYAAPHTDEPQVTLRIQKAKRSMSFSVQDNGPGIAEREMNRLFTAFRRSAKDAADSGAPGVGLGLALSRRIANRLGGELNCLKNSTGTCFKFSLPYLEH